MDKDMNLKIKKVEEEIGKAIIGQKDIVRDVLIAILAGGNVLLEGMPGLGKTELVKTISKVLDLNFSRIQFTPDLMPSDVVGTNIVVKEEKGSKFEFQKGPIFTNLLLADEINRATPKTQSALLEAMQEHTVTVANETYALNEPFMVLATQNPVEMEGTYPLPEAQMDRFLFKLLVKFPTLEELSKIIDVTTTNDKVELEKVMRQEEILELKQEIMKIPIAEPVKNYALKLVLWTHPENSDSPKISKSYINYGAGPRAAQAIIRASKVKAFMEGRFNVSFSDINYVAYPCLRHRFFLNFEGISEGITQDAIIEKLISESEKNER